MSRKGRPQKPYRTSDGETVLGLTRSGDGRWRISATGVKFTEPDERRAVARFRKWERSQSSETVIVSVPATAFANKKAFNAAWEGDVQIVPACDDEPARLEVELPERLVYAWIKQELTANLALFAEKVGVPELASLPTLSLPKPPVRVRAVMEAYKAHSSATAKSKQEALKPFKDLIAFAAAKTLDHLDEAVLVKYREHIVKKYKTKSSGTVVAYFSRIRNVIRISRRGHLDSVQIDAAVARCSAKLYPPESNVVKEPKPITRENFHKLLGSVSKTQVPEVWRAMLLLGLNAAMYMQELCDLKWESLDLTNCTLATQRNKTGTMPRAAVLWPETVKALRALRRRGDSPYLFTSPHGTKYNKCTKINDFRDLCLKAGVTGVTFSHLRDGALSAARKTKGVKQNHVRYLAGHTMGIEDNYIPREPEDVRPATEAVYRFYLQ